MTRPVEIDLSGWEGHRTPGEVGVRVVPVDPRVVRAVEAPAWSAVRVWCPESPPRVLAEVMVTVEGPLVLVYVEEMDSTTFEALLKPLHGRKVKARIRAVPSMLDAADGVVELTCPRHSGAFRIQVADLADGVHTATRDRPLNLRAERHALG